MGRKEEQSNQDSDQQGILKKHEWTRKSVREAIASGTYMSMPMSTAEMFNIFEVDAREWNVKKKKVNHWGKQFQTTLELERKHCSFEASRHLKKLREWGKNKKAFKKFPDFKGKKPSEDPKLLQIFLTDVHFDKYALAEETGTDYTLKIAQKVYLDCVTGIIRKAEPLGFDRILFVVGSDLYNSEGLRSTTTKGTPQFPDEKWQVVLDVVQESVCQAISYCREKAPVDVVVIPGNHDEERVYSLGKAVEAWYRNIPEVAIDITKGYRKCYTYGSTAILFDHGELKASEYPQLFATDFKKEWCATDHQYVALGHKHGHHVTEIHGVKVECYPSVSATDTWHFKSGYTGNKRSAIGKLYSYTDGEAYVLPYFPSADLYNKD